MWIDWAQPSGFPLGVSHGAATWWSMGRASSERCGWAGHGFLTDMSGDSAPWLLCSSTWLHFRASPPGIVVSGSFISAWQLAPKRQEVEVARAVKGHSGLGTLSLPLYYFGQSGHRAQSDLRRWEQPLLPMKEQQSLDAESNGPGAVPGRLCSTVCRNIDRLRHRNMKGPVQMED